MQLEYSTNRPLKDVAARFQTGCIEIEDSEKRRSCGWGDNLQNRLKSCHQNVWDEMS